MPVVNLTVNSRSVSVPEGASLLQAVEAAGVTLPTLCYHPGLAPYGACRLCMVTITSPRHALVASCVHPAEEGQVVATDAPDAVAARRLALEFLLSRCPASEALRQLAADAGVIFTRFGGPPAEKADELCMLCGLCVRVCREAIGAAALAFINRGGARRVSTPFDLHADACIGCGACAEVCPTGAIRIEDRGSQRILHTWHTTVALTPCPSCGRFFAPQPMAFLAEMVPEVEALWTLCPGCRNRQTARQWIAQVAAS